MFQTLLIVAALGQISDPPKIVADPPKWKKDYAACVSHVTAGGKAILAVGVDAPPGAYRVASLQDTAPGLWECYPERGRLMMRPLAVPKRMEQPLKQFVRQCVNGVCRLVEVEPNP